MAKSHLMFLFSCVTRLNLRFLLGLLNIPDIRFLFSQYETLDIRHNVNIDVSKSTLQKCHVIILKPLYT